MNWMKTTDAVTGKPYLRICDPEYDLTFGYYTNNMWIDNRSLVLVRRKKGENGEPWQCVRVNLETLEWKALPVYVHDFASFLVDGEWLYGILNDTFFRFDMSRENAVTEPLCHEKGMTFPHATKDGRYFCWMVYCNGRMTASFYDVQTGKRELLTDKRFKPPFPHIGHVMLSPTDPDLTFFCHEGDTFYVSNRLWLIRRGEKPRNIAEQKLNADGDLGDCYGHECWAPDGKGLYFVKYACAPEPPRGICYVNAEDGKAELLYSKYPYWHVSCAPSGRMLASDTQSGTFSGVCLIDLETGEEEMVVRTATTWQHPCHPHPQYNFSGDRLTFHEQYDSGCAVGVLKLHGVVVEPWDETAGN